jgi:Arc/MetJ family transcription regulator
VGLPPTGKPVSYNCPVCDALEVSLRIRRLQVRNGSMFDVSFRETCGCSLGIAAMQDAANSTTTWRSVTAPPLSAAPICEVGERPGTRIYSRESLDMRGRGGHVAKTLIDIPEELLAEAAEVAGTSTKKDTVIVALEQLVARRRRAKGIEWLSSSSALADLTDPDVVRSARR